MIYLFHSLRNFFRIMKNYLSKEKIALPDNCSFTGRAFVFMFLILFNSGLAE